jgi:hypothetical protein
MKIDRKRPWIFVQLLRVYTLTVPCKSTCSRKWFFLNWPTTMIGEVTKQCTLDVLNTWRGVLWDQFGHSSRPGIMGGFFSWPLEQTWYHGRLFFVGWLQHWQFRWGKVFLAIITQQMCFFLLPYKILGVFISRRKASFINLLTWHGQQKALEAFFYTQSVDGIIESTCHFHLEMGCYCREGFF